MSSITFCEKSSQSHLESLLTVKPLNPTDLKIYETVAESHFFKNLGYLLISGSAIYAIFFPLSFVLIGTGVFGVTAVAIDTWVHSSSAIPSSSSKSSASLPIKEKSSSISSSSGSGSFSSGSISSSSSSFYPTRPFVPGQPVGIKRNGTCDCWIISIIQFVFAIPSLHAHLDKNGPDCIKQALTHYDKAQKSSQHTAEAISTYPIRAWFAKTFREISSNSGHQEDAHEGLSKLLQKNSTYAPMKIQLQRKWSGKTELQNHSIFPINLANLFSFVTFEQLISANLDLEDTGGGGTLRFIESPNELLFQFARFNVMGKINNDVPAPLTFKMPKDWLLPGKTEATYSCRTFIEHIGNSDKRGHYVCYIKDKNNTWWQCDDDRITQVSKSDAAKALQRSYICYFEKTT